MTPDPYAPYLRQADDLFAQGETVKAGQIWQAILKQQPGHFEARERLMAVKTRLIALREAEAAMAAPPEPPAAALAPPEAVPVPEPDPEPGSPVEATPQMPPPPAPVKVITGALDPERLVAEGCTLYDMGQLGDALRKWEQALTLDPAHALARGYANGARRELGMAPIQADPTPAPVPQAFHQEDEDLDKLLREAVQLYDMGLTEEAITKWERVLALDPQRQEVEGYLRQARKEVGLSASSPAQAPTPAQSAGPEGLDLKLRQAEHLLTLQRKEEAAFTFQQALSLDPGNARALQGLERCRATSPRTGSGSSPRPVPAPLVTLDPQGRIAMAEGSASAAEPMGVEPPAALLKAAQPPRKGLSLPERYREAAERLPWLKDSRILAGVGGGVLVLALGFGAVHSYRKDQALKEDVRAAKAAAVAPVAQQSQAPDLAESPESIQREAEASLVNDPLRAYLRAQAFVNRNPGDQAGPQLLEKARTGLSGGVSGASLPEFQKHLQNGDLEAAHRVMDALLRAQPDDADLRARAGRLYLVLCSAHASQAKWDAAQEDLMRGRALFPGDKSWQVRLKLLEHVKALPKNQQAAWISLLG